MSVWKYIYHLPMSPTNTVICLLQANMSKDQKVKDYNWSDLQVCIWGTLHCIKYKEYAGSTDRRAETAE